MNIDPLTIYLWQLADRLLSFCNWLWWPCFLVSVLALVFWGVSWDADAGLEDVRPAVYRLWKWFVPPAVLLSLASVLIPSSNTIAMMVVIPKIADSKVIQADIPDLYNAAVEALKSSFKK